MNGFDSEYATENNNIEILVNKTKDKYLLYNDVIELFPDEKETLYEEYISYYNVVIKLYGKEKFTKSLNSVLNNINKYNSLQSPELVRQLTFKGNTLWHLVKTCYLYQCQADNYLSENHNELYNKTLEYVSKYKRVAFYKYGVEEFNKTYKEILIESL